MIHGADEVEIPVLLTPACLQSGDLIIIIVYPIKGCGFALYRIAMGFQYVYISPLLRVLELLMMVLHYLLDWVMAQ